MVSMEKIYSNIADHLYLLESLLSQSLTRFWQFILHSFIWPQNCHVLIQELSFKTMLQVSQLSRHYYNLAHLLNLCESFKFNTYKKIQLEEERVYLGYKNGGHKLGSSKCVFGLLPMNSSHKSKKHKWQMIFGFFNK